MDRAQLIDLAFDNTTLDGDVIDGLTDDQLRELLNLQDINPARPDKPRKQRTRKPLVIHPTIERVDYVIGKGDTLVRKFTFTDESITYVRCGERVTFEGKQVSASIVLHWLKTGEWVTRTPRVAKPYRAVIREGRTVKHLGRFATKEERDAAIVNHKLGFVPTK